MNASWLFTLVNEYPVFPIAIICSNTLSFFPIICLLYISQIAPLHNNCRYILCVWAIGYSAVFILNIIFAVLDMKNDSGYMPLSMFEPHLRFNLYQLHVMCTVFCSTFEIALSIERLVAIVQPRQYHFTGFAWEILITLTLVLMSTAYAIDYCVHSDEGKLIIIGCSLMIFIELSVLVAGAIAMEASRMKYQRMYGHSSLTERYQVKEAYEMSKAMMPTYVTSFVLKASTITALCAYFVVRTEHGYLLGYLEAYYFLIDAINGSFSMILLLHKHPQLRKQTIRKFWSHLGNQPTQKISHVSSEEVTEKYFAILSEHWK